MCIRDSIGIVKVSSSIRQLARMALIDVAKFKKNKSDLSDEMIEIKIKERNQARDDKNYELADKIRNELLEKGVQIEDKDGKTSWKFK